MKFLNYNTLLLFLFIAMLGCNQYAKSIYPIPSKKLSKQEVYYKTTYGRINFLNDTIIIDNNQIYRSYSQGLLKKIGRIHNTKPMGYWFTFEDSLNLEYILKYNGDKVDSFYHPFAIIQQRW